MNDLKTLKDMPLSCPSEFANVKGCTLCVQVDNLRQEAIKWVKADKFNPITFFNLTEDDLS